MTNPEDISVDSKEWAFDADPNEFKIASEAYRINLAYLFDPYIAVRTSSIDPLPHQIAAVYKEMLPKMPLRYVLADDPGAGKTIMTGLLIKEMIARGDLKRCLIVCPGNLVEQWQDELQRKFGLSFTILTNSIFNADTKGNVFNDYDLCIARLDKLARNDDLQEKLKSSEWDLVVCDEAHKMSASVYGADIKYTKRYKLGVLLGDITENLVLLTATPHNGIPKDFQLFMALVDRDRFEGANHNKSKSQEKTASRTKALQQPTDKTLNKPDFDVSDVMRRLVKEELLKFDGRPLFPERRAQTVTYTLSPAEEELYQLVTNYVTEEFNRADKLDGKRKNSVGFALTVLQRRLASSPEAIYQSLRRRRERLELRLEELLNNTQTAISSFECDVMPADFDEDDYTPEELEELENNAIDTASTADTQAELEAEISTLKLLENKADEVCRSGRDRKWEELNCLLQDTPEMFGSNGRREKLIIFTEYKDTLTYLENKIRDLFGNPDTVITIQGGMSHSERHKAEERFKQDENVQILIATDAAGEGINLQSAHLMVNYDLPWNPNRIEQRFGRIHRIGQTEVCHLWNLVANQTREGKVFERLFQKLEEERVALGGRVFDILGSVTYQEKPLRELLLEAIRYGDRPEVRDRLNRVVDSSLDGDALKNLLDKYALASDVMDIRSVMKIKEEMECIDARKLAPHYIEAFFIEAMNYLGGAIVEREEGCYEVLDVPFSVRSYDAGTSNTNPVLRRYERICFNKKLTDKSDGVKAELVCPGHPLLDVTVAVMLEKKATALRQGTIFIDDDIVASSDTPRFLFFVESAIQDETLMPDGSKKVVSRAVHFVEIDHNGNVTETDYAPYLDYRAPTNTEHEAVEKILATEMDWLKNNPEKIIEDPAVKRIISAHKDEVSDRVCVQVNKVKKAVESRLTSEIHYWDYYAGTLADNERAGKPNTRISSRQAERRASELVKRLKQRTEQLNRQMELSAAQPRIIGGALVIPALYLRAETSDKDTQSVDVEAKRDIEMIAMKAVMSIEDDLGYEPKDVSRKRGIGYDIESRDPEALTDGDKPIMRMIEVKGRAAGADSVSLSRNEISCGLNEPQCWMLAIVEVGENTTKTTYLKRPAMRAPSFAENSVNFDIGRLIESAEVVLERTC